MMTKPVWEEYRTQWPPAYWDDWLRHPDRRHGRACIRPEVSRTYTFGEKGTSQAQQEYSNEDDDDDDDDVIRQIEK